MDISKGSEAIDRRIDPAIQWNIWRPLIGRGPISVPSEEFSDRSPFPAAEVRIAMPAVNILRDKVSNHAANEHVRRKMLVSFHARDTDQRRQAVGHNLSERSRVFMCDHPRHRPCRSRMFRGKGSAAALKKRSAAVAKGSFASQRILYSLNYHQTVQRRFT